MTWLSETKECTASLVYVLLSHCTRLIKGCSNLANVVRHAHTNWVFQKGPFPYWSACFHFFACCLWPLTHITGISVLIYFKDSRFLWQPVHRLQTSFKTELQHILKRFFQFCPACTGSFSLLHRGDARCPTVIYSWNRNQHGATEVPAPSEHSLHANPLHRKRNCSSCWGKCISICDSLSINIQ